MLKTYLWDCDIKVECSVCGAYQSVKKPDGEGTVDS